MEGKDNRSLGKRKAMKQLKNKRNAGHTTSSSTPPLRGIADYVDSSDERFVKREGRWGGGGGSKLVQPSRSYDLDLLNDLDDAQPEQMRAADFQDLQTSTAVSGHFKFSSEKDWDEDADLDSVGEYFTLNLKLLNAGLKTIPFYKRMDYPSSMFTPNELVEMEKDAEIAEKDYQLIQIGDTNPQINITTESGGSVKSAPPDDKSEEVKELVNATEKASLNDAPPAATANNDIQDWLDSVLEEGE